MSSATLHKRVMAGRKRRWLLPVLFACLLLGGCSFGAKLAYNNLDWLVARQVDDYVTLDDAQQEQFDAAFQRWWDWHRETQLPLYAAALRELAGQAEQPLELAQLQAAQQRVGRFSQAAMEQGFADVVELLRTLSDGQVEELLAAIADDTEEFREDAVEPDAETLLHERSKAMRKGASRRLGRLDENQKQAIEQWAAAHEDLGPQWLERRQLWQREFAEALARRDAPDFSERMQALMFREGRSWPQSLREAAGRNEQRWLELLVTLSESTSERQRERFRDQLREWAEICVSLVEQGAKS